MDGIFVVGLIIGALIASLFFSIPRDWDQAMSTFLTIAALLVAGVSFALGAWALVFWMLDAVGGPATIIVLVVVIAVALGVELRAKP